MSQCGDQNDIFVYVLNVFIGIAIAVYFLPCKKNHPVGVRYVTLYHRIFIPERSDPMSVGSAPSVGVITHKVCEYTR